MATHADMLAGIRYDLMQIRQCYFPTPASDLYMALVAAEAALDRAWRATPQGQAHCELTGSTHDPLDDEVVNLNVAIGDRAG